MTALVVTFVLTIGALFLLTALLMRIPERDRPPGSSMGE